MCETHGRTSRARAGRAGAGLAAALALAVPFGAPAADRSVVPGLMGYNALPTVRNADPAVGEDVELEVQVAAQLSSLFGARDAAATPYLRLEIPFAGVAAIEVDAVPVELWRVSPETQARTGAARPSGTAAGDLRFGARFLLLSEGGWWPALGARFLTKSTTGDGPADRRFTNSPAYLIDALLGRDLPLSLGPFERVRLLGKVGFTSWQQGDAWQDDALDLGATLRLLTRERTRIEVEWRAYFGYERHDRPQVLGFTLGIANGPVEWLAILNRGLGPDAPPWEVRLGVGVRVRAPWARPEPPPGAR